MIIKNFCHLTGIGNNTTILDKSYTNCVFDPELGRSGFIFRQNSPGFFDAVAAYVQNSLTPLRLREVTLLRSLLQHLKIITYLKIRMTFKDQNALFVE